MKVLHVVPSVGPARGGPSRAVLDMCTGLARAGTDVTLVTTDDNGLGRLDVPLGQPVSHDGYEIQYFGRQARPYTISIPLLRWLDENVDRFNLVHVHAVFSHVSDWAPSIIRRHSKPYGVTPHGILCEWGMRRRRLAAKRVFYRLLVGPNLKQAAFVHFTSDQDRHEAAAWGALLQSVIIPLGLTLTPREVSCRTPVREGALNLLFLSRIDPIKGLECLFRAMTRALQQACPLRLVVAGDGDPGYVRTLQDLAVQLGIAEWVDWAGFVEGADKQRLLAQADVFVLPSHSESFGVVVVEAIAAGLPVVITERVGIHEAVQRANAGLIIPCDDARALAFALIRLANRPDLCGQMSTNGRCLAHNSFSLPATTRRLIALYDKSMPQQKAQVVP